MSESSMLSELRRNASKETMRRLELPDGRATLYFTDHAGREFYTLLGPKGQFQGTHRVERPAPKP